MLPIRLGMVNAERAAGADVFTLTPRGRVETTNYRMVKAPTGGEVPMYVKARLPRVHARRVRSLGRAARACAPCSSSTRGTRAGATLARRRRCRRTSCVSWARRGCDGDQSGGSIQVFVTRLHARYDAAHRSPRTWRSRRPATPTTSRRATSCARRTTATCDCPAGQEYRSTLVARHDAQRASLMALTGWDEDRVRAAMSDGEDAYLPAVSAAAMQDTWWNKIWRR